MDIKVFKPQIRGPRTKVAICSPELAAKIYDSSSDASEDTILFLKRKGSGIFDLDPTQDPDNASVLLYIEESLNYREKIKTLARLSDLYFEKYISLVGHDEFWPREMEAYAKASNFELIAGEIAYTKLKPIETEVSIVDLDQKVKIFICEKERIAKVLGRRASKHLSEKTDGLAGNYSGMCLYVWVDSSNPTVKVLYHEVIHIKQRILKGNLRTENASPELEEVILRIIFDRIFDAITTTVE